MPELPGRCEIAEPAWGVLRGAVRAQRRDHDGAEREEREDREGDENDVVRGALTGGDSHDEPPSPIRLMTNETAKITSVRQTPSADAAPTLPSSKAW